MKLSSDSEVIFCFCSRGENVFHPHFGGENVEFVSHCALSGIVSAAPAARLRPAARHSIMRPATQRVV